MKFFKVHVQLRTWTLYIRLLFVVVYAHIRLYWGNYKPNTEEVGLIFFSSQLGFQFITNRVSPNIWKLSSYWSQVRLFPHFRISFEVHDVFCIKYMVSWIIKLSNKSRLVVKSDLIGYLVIWTSVLLTGPKKNSSIQNIVSLNTPKNKRRKYWGVHPLKQEFKTRLLCICKKRVSTVWNPLNKEHLLTSIPFYDN